MARISTIIITFTVTILVIGCIQPSSSAPINWDNISLTEEQKDVVGKVDDLLNDFLDQFIKKYGKKDKTQDDWHNAHSQTTTETDSFTTEDEFTTDEAKTDSHTTENEIIAEETQEDGLTTANPTYPNAVAKSVVNPQDINESEIYDAYLEDQKIIFPDY